MIILSLCLDTGRQFLMIRGCLCCYRGSMKYIIRIFFSILSYALVLYLLDSSGFLFWITFDYNTPTPYEITKIYALIGIVFWLSFTVIRSILKVVMFPLNMFFFGIVWWIVNIVVVYICQFLINFYLDGVTMEITSLFWVLITSFVIWVIVSIVYRVLKKI